MTSCDVRLGMRHGAILLVSAVLSAAKECHEGGGCRNDFADDTSLLSIRKPMSQVPQSQAATPAISSSMKPQTQDCSVGQNVLCPGSDDAWCAGNQCCSGASGQTFPCPSAASNFTECDQPKMVDCTRSMILSTPAVAGAELATSSNYKYGRFEARIQYAGGDGDISSFFLWKPGSETSNVYWNELDYEKLGTYWNNQGEQTCKMQLNLIDGMPGPQSHEEVVALEHICSEFHIYAFEWTPDYIRWTVDNTEVRKETGWLVDQFNQNANPGMEFHFNLWVGDQSFGGTWSDGELPLYQYIDWVRYSSYDSGSFTQVWQENFDGDSMPSGWFAGSWNSPLGHSVHRPQNIVFTQGYAVLALTSTSDTPTAASIPPP